MSTGTTGNISKRVEKELHQRKVVIRRLPPDFTEEKLKHTINPLPSYTYFYFAPGDPTLGPHGCSRAYIAFENEAEIVSFRDQYDGLVLESERGTKYRVTVEYAPSQATPRKARKKPDARTGTIDQDSDYKAFLETYETKDEPTSSLDLMLYLEKLDANKAKDVQSTPLTEYLKDKRGSRSRRSRAAADSKKKHKGESSRGKNKSSREDESSSKTSKTSREDSSRGESRRKDRGRQDKSTDLPKLSSKDQQSEKGSGRPKSSQGPKIDSATSVQTSREPKETDRESRRESKGRYDSGDRYRGDKSDTRTRNRDRPDKTIYTPRGHGRDESSKGGGDKTGKSKEEGASYQGRSQRYRGRREDGDYRQRDRDDRPSGKSRDRGRGPRDRQKERSEAQASRND